MTSLDVSIMDAVLPVALANAALLITAPSLGCLTTYTRALNDLCHIYGLPSPDLSRVIQYSKKIMMPSSISPERPDESIKQEFSEESQVLESSTPTMVISSSSSVKYDERQEVTPGTKDTEEPVCSIKDEHEEPMLKKLKQEVENYKEMYNACRKPPQTKQDETDKFGIQLTNLNSKIRQNEKYFNQNDSERHEVQTADQNDPERNEIKPEILVDLKWSGVHPANQNIAVRFAVQPANKNDKVRSRVRPVNQNHSGQPENQTAISILSAEQQPSNTGTLMETSIEKLSVPITTNNNKTSVQPKCDTLYSYLSPDGSLMEEVEMIHHEIMPVKYLELNKLGFNMKPKDAVLKVLTFGQGLKRSPWLYISIKNRQDLPISFGEINNIRSNGHDCIMIHYSFIMHCIQCEASITSSGKIRSAKENKKALLDWLRSFLR